MDKNSYKEMMLEDARLQNEIAFKSNKLENLKKNCDKMEERLTLIKGDYYHFKKLLVFKLKIKFKFIWN